jgi:hypothetical protein
LKNGGGFDNVAKGINELSPRTEPPEAIDLLFARLGRALGKPIVHIWLTPIVLSVTAFVMIFFIAYYDLRYTDLLYYPDIMHETISFTQPRPFVFRVFVPALIRVIHDISPIALNNLFVSIEELAPRYGFHAFLPASTDLSPDMIPYYYDTALIYVVSLAATVVLVRIAYKRFFPDSRISGIVFIPYLLCLSAIVACGVAKAYDFPSMVLILAMLLAMHAGRTAVFLMLFAVACATKETAILFTLTYLLYNWTRMPRDRLWLTAGAQLGIFLIVYGAIRFAFRDNPGVAMQFGLPGQIQWALRPSIPGLAAFLLVLFLTLYEWREKPAVLKATAGTIIPYIPIYFVAGYHGELRALFEIFPFVVLLICRNIELIGRRCLR